MKVAMLQLNFKVGDIAGNTSKIIGGYKKACKSGSELVVSTELALFGYPPKDMLEHSNYLDYQDEQLKILKKNIGGIGLIVGIVERSKGKLFNSAVLIQNGKIVFTQKKALLPNRDVFDERRYFEPNPDTIITLVPYKGKRLALLICEDIWNGTEENGQKMYKRDPVEELVGLSPDALITINASPYYWKKGIDRLDLVAGIARRIGCPVVYANQVGGNDDLIFDGRSFAVDKNGFCIACGKEFIEDVIMVDIKEIRMWAPKYIHDDNLGSLYNALVLGTRDYAHKSGFKEAVIASSGGIDSALVECIAADALGADKIKAVGMPSKYSSSDSVKDAKELANNLGVEFLTIPIKKLFNAYKDTLSGIIGWYPSDAKKGDVTEENIQARIRGNIIMAISNRENRIVLSTGNKSELSVGYCTLYGDMAGGLAVISDISKMLAYKLAEYRNTRGMVIPGNVIVKPPSAELRPGQKDEDSLPPYSILDSILSDYVEKQKGTREIVDSGQDEETVRWVISAVDRNEYKRRQMPVGLKVTRKAFGPGRRWPVAAKFVG